MAATIIVADDFSWCLEDNPEFASQAGFHFRSPPSSTQEERSGGKLFPFALRLQDLSPAAFVGRRTHALSVVQAADEILVTGEGEPKSSLRALELLRNCAVEEADAIQMGCHLLPINSIGYGGVLNNFVEALDWLPAKADDSGPALRRDLEELLRAEQQQGLPPAAVSVREWTVLHRVEHFPEQVAQYIELLRHGLSRGIVATKSALRKVPQQLEQAETELRGQEHAVQKELAGLLDRADCRQRATDALKRFADAVATLGTFIQEDYAPRARSGDGCTSLTSETSPNLGRDWYALCLRYHTTTHMTAEEVHEEGLLQVARIEKRYRDDVLKPLGRSSDSFDQFVEDLRSDKSHCVSSPDELLDGYRAELKAIQEKMPQFFADFPKSALDVVPITLETLPAAYYVAGTADGKRNGRFSVNVSNLDARPTYEMTSLALHEGNPGNPHRFCLWGLSEMLTPQPPLCFFKK
jgi:Bacterial protein of unknown function (DUF885)